MRSAILWDSNFATVETNLEKRNAPPETSISVSPETPPLDIGDRAGIFRKADIVRDYLRTAATVEGIFSALDYLGSVETSGVPLEAAEVKSSVTALLEKVRSGLDVSDQELQTIPREYGLRQRVTDVLKMERIRQLLNQAA